MTIRPRRSVLYMPGSNARVLEKARTLPADCLIFDLEDAVAPEAKEMARAQVAEAVASGRYGRRERIIRVNALDTEWFEADLAAAVAARPDAILAPKISRPEEVIAVFDRMHEAGADGIALWAMMETPLAMLNVRDIAAISGEAPLAAFVMGTNDLAKETGAALDGDRFAFIPWLMSCVAAAKAFGLDIIDGVYNDFRDEDGFAAECRQGRAMGMTGKTLIHPAQIGPANDIFAPSREDIARAEEIVAAFELPENAGKGAINIGGRMVELLHLEVARRTLELARAIAEAEGAS